MNLNFSNIMEEKLFKKVFNTYTLYIVLAIVVFSNVFLFPDLLNHPDIKLNDMSYLINRQIDIKSAPIESISNANVEDNLMNKGELVQDEQQYADAAELVNNISDSVEVIKPDDRVNADVNSKVVQDEQEVEKENTLVPEAEETLTIIDDTTSKNVDNETVAAADQEASVRDTSDLNNVVNAENNSEKSESNANESVTSVNSIKGEEGEVKSNLNVFDNSDNSEVIINNDTEVDDSFLKNQDDQVQINTIESIEENKQNTRKMGNFYYIVLLFVLLSSFVLGFVMFIHKNYHVFQQNYYSAKSTYKIRDYLYNGYELLED